MDSKICSKCGEKKSLSEFNRAAKGAAGRRRDCKQCTAAYDRERYEAAMRRDTMGFTRKYREKELQKRYKIGVDDYDAMLELQGDRCGICGVAETGRTDRINFDVDHSHETGKVRGLLCNRCNRGLAYFGDNPEALRAAARYLEKANGAPRR